MKKLLSILLTIALLFSLCLTVSADTTDGKDDNRFDMGEIFGYYYEVTFVDGENRTEQEFERNTAITYPAITPVRGADKVWSAAADKYEAVPTTMPENDITVYAYSIPTVGFENYDKNVCGDSNGVIDISSDYVNDGEKALKFSNVGANDDRLYSIALGQSTAATAYKISFKYYLPEALGANYYIDPFTADDSLNAANDFTDSRFTISQNSETGVWHSGNIYFTATDSNYVYLWLKSSAYGNGDVIYFDSFVTEEMVTASFVLNNSVVCNSKNGVLRDNVFTAYYGLNDAITAPDVKTVNDSKDVLWVDSQGNTVTEFESGATYYIKADAKGDLNVDGAVTTTDLALIKLYIVEKIDASSVSVTNADINLNGKADVIDMAYLKLYLAGIVENL
ncbi:MAG: dockerin type I repeat-containing protein [Clostridia bacterium]|nr:dockerin type I repeat-containing protein [Clostridia bacterium]